MFERQNYSRFRGDYNKMNFYKDDQYLDYRGKNQNSDFDLEYPKNQLIFNITKFK